MTAPRPRVVIVGAGFGGLWAARSLARGPADVRSIFRGAPNVEVRMAGVVGVDVDG